jgi:hypothetical protein
MIVLGVDAGDSVGLALVERMILQHLSQVPDTSTPEGARALLAALRALPAPDLVVIEDPANVRRGSSERARHQLQRRVGAVLFAVAVAWDAPPRVVLVPTATWQAWAHRGKVEASPKERSLARLREAQQVAGLVYRGPRGGDLDDAWDAGCLALFGAFGCA